MGSPENRFSLEVRLDADDDGTLAEDVRAGLGSTPKSLPPKHFYDDRGSRLFDEICDLPEYYLTRAERALLERFADDVLTDTRPTDLVELGSGTSRKTRLLLDAVDRDGRELTYHPIDVCEPVLRGVGRDLLRAYDWLEVRALAADYEQHLDELPPGRRRLVAFLGSTIGNFSEDGAASFVARIGGCLERGEHLLLGADLVKGVDDLEAAYNDAAGVTAEFNRNVLRVINRELGGHFDTEDFEHVAFFNRDESQIEMHLRARRAHRVAIDALELEIPFVGGETIHTESSRKFDRARLEGLLEGAGMALRRWMTPSDESFALVLAERL